MSFIRAKGHFESALAVAERSNNSAMEFIASGLLELAKSMQAMEREVSSIKTTAEAIKRHQ